MTYTDRIAQRALDKGWDAGLKAGNLQSIETGRQEGEAMVVTQILTRKFGSIPTKYLQYIQQAKLDVLLVLLEKAWTAETLDELFIDLQSVS